MRQGIRKKQSKHSNARSNRSTRTKRRTGKKSRVSMKGGGDFPYDAIVFDIDETILPKLCGTLRRFFDEDGNFITEVKKTTKSNKIKTIADQDIKDENGLITGIKKFRKNNAISSYTLLNTTEIDDLIRLLDDLKNNKNVLLFLATRCQPTNHINHPFVLLDQVPKKFQNLHTKLNKLRSLFLKTGTNELRVFGAVADGYNKPKNKYTGSIIATNPKELVENKQTGALFDKYGTDIWANYKESFLLKLQTQLKKKNKGHRILFVDDSNANAKKAAAAGFDSYTRQTETVDSIKWTITALKDALKIPLNENVEVNHIFYKASESKLFSLKANKDIKDATEKTLDDIQPSE